MKATVNNGVLTLAPAGKVDSTNAPAFENEVFAATAENPHTSVVLDADDLQYLSSAGLRVILKLRKEEPTLKIVNASTDVYEIFEMTGFTEMIPVSKAYRKIDVTGCEVIGEGANGKVYRIDPDTIVKVYVNPDSLGDIQRERDLARRAFVLGVPTAISYDVCRVEGSYGSVFELLNAKPLAQILREDRSTLDYCVKTSVDLLKIIHGTEVRPEDMPDMRDVAIDWAKFVAKYLPEEKGNKLASLVEAVPVEHKMMHGDYHIKNVMVQNGEALLIDMDTLCQGNPVFEFASIYNAYIGFFENKPEKRGSFLGITPEDSEAFWQKTLRLYFDTEDEGRLTEVSDKARLVGFTRLMRRTIRRGALDTEEGRKEVELYKSLILDLLDKVDSLAL